MGLEDVLEVSGCIGLATTCALSLAQCARKKDKKEKIKKKKKKKKKGLMGRNRRHWPEFQI